MTRIAITGIGVVAPGAIGVEAFARLLREGQPATTRIARFDTAESRAHTAALVRDFQPRDFIAPLKLRRMNTLSRYAVAAARLALDDVRAPLSADAGVAVGTVFGPVQTSAEYMRDYVEKGAALAPPQLFAESVANAPGSHVAIEFGLRGFNVTFTQRESSALAALMYAASQIMKGAVPCAVIGGVEEVSELVFNVLDSIRALARTVDGIEECSRPFDRQRNGMVIGEGGAMLVAEAEPGRPPYAWISGFGIARDHTASISDWGDGHEAVASAMRAAVDDAGLSLSDIDAVYASANSARRADRLEYRAIQTLFRQVPPVVGAKGIFGEYAAAGALQLVAAILALREQTLHPTAGFRSGDDQMRFTPVCQTTARPLRHILVNSISAGGGIICAVLSREAA